MVALSSDPEVVLLDSSVDGNECVLTLRDQRGSVKFTFLRECAGGIHTVTAPQEFYEWLIAARAFELSASVTKVAQAAFRGEEVPRFTRIKRP